MASSYSYPISSAILALVCIIISQSYLATCDKAIAVKIVEVMKKCGQAVGAKSNAEMTSEKLPCFTKCIMEEGGLVDANGQPHKENILRDVDAAAPPATKQAYKKALEACIDNHGQTLVPSDPTCASYAALGNCVVDAIKTIRKVHI